MSIEVLLIPLGIAAIAAIKEARSSDLCERCKDTRITDQELLVQGLAMIGVVDIVQADGRVTGSATYGPITFQRVGQVFLGRVDTGSDLETAALLVGLERAIGGIVQQRSVSEIRQRASELGMTLIEERSEGGTVQFIFEQV